MKLTVLDCGSCEPLKAGVHMTMAALTTVCGVYNAAAFIRRPARHLLANVITYVLLTAWEVNHVRCHRRGK